MSRQVHDFVAVGLGPFNLGLACLTDPVDGLDGVFLEREQEFHWHPGMLIPGTTLQTPFLADLVTLADPTSPYSFLNYLKQTGRLYRFYIRESFFPLRREYVDYCRWVAAQLPTLRFGQTVTSVEYDDAEGVYLVHAHRTDDPRERTTHRGRRLVLGTGTVPHVPPACAALDPPPVHSAEYLRHKPQLQRCRRIAVVGSGQSAAEIFHDLLQGADDHGYALAWLTRSPRFFPLEYTKLTLEMTSPDYTDYFHGLPAATRDRLNRDHTHLYKGIDSSLIDAIYEALYQRDVAGAAPPRLLPATSVARAHHDPDRGGYVLALHHDEQQTESTLTTDGLVLATGYRYQLPDFLAPVAHRIATDDAGRFAVRRNYSVDTADRGEIFVQNAELHTHGFVAPDLGMGAYRNAYLIREMAGREYYPVETTIAFQDFGTPAPQGAP